jgi:epoxyqueuosine reductase QueG
MLHISRTVVKALRDEGVAAITPSESFPQDMSKLGGRMFTVSHKPVAEAAGLGRIGHHRLLIHPIFGSHLCLGTIIVGTALDVYDQPIDYNPCIGCKLCVATCPTGAIAPDGSFEFVKCLVHAYRDRLGGFLNWVESLVTSQNMNEYREKRTDGETLAVWQSLTYGGGYRCGYCMSVCPAGMDLIGPYLDNRKEYIRSVVKPLQEKKENVYVLPDQNSATAVSRKFPNKTARQSC